MRDGQVHDVAAVALTLRQVKEQLEHDTGVTFSSAHNAAAGRTLRTERGSAHPTHPHHVAFTKEMNHVLEWEAVADAQQTLLASLEREEQAKGFYCIAHYPTARW